MSERYRVGNHQPRNPYRGDEYIGVMFDPTDTAMIAELLNEQDDMVPADQEFPQEFRDGDGDYWDRRAENGKYFLRNEGMLPRTLDYIKTHFGTWDEAAG